MSRRSNAGARPVNGLLLLDKPPGLSSNQCLQQARQALNARKGGHTGSLDPFATGMLPLCFGEATKFSQFLLDADKHYEAVAQLGEATTTGDPEGEISERAAVPALDIDAVNAALAQFVGPQMQKPPMYSAIKMQGKRLYQLARDGIEVERPRRAITIHEIECIELAESSLRLRVHCSKGTYIRVLMEDVARALGTVAHTTVLRRTAVAPFGHAPMVSLDQPASELEAALLPIDAGLAGLQKQHLSAQQTHAICCGRPLPCAELNPGLYRLYDPNQQFLGVATATDDSWLKPMRLLSSAVAEA